MMLVNSFHKIGVFSCLFCCQLIKKASLVNLHQIPPVIPVIPVSSLLYSGGHFQKNLRPAISVALLPTPPCYGGSLTYLEDHPSQYGISNPHLHVKMDEPSPRLWTRSPSVMGSHPPSTPNPGPPHRPPLPVLGKNSIPTSPFIVTASTSLI